MPNPGKPTALKVLTGNPGKRKLNPEEPAAKRGQPAMPAFLIPVAQDEWKAIVPILLGLNVLTTADGSALAAYCMSFARWREAEAAVSQYGLLLEEPVFNKEGDEVGTRYKKNPACTEAIAQKKEMRAALALFGLDPSSRSRIKGATQEKPKSPLAQLLEMRREQRAKA